MLRWYLGGIQAHLDAAFEFGWRAYDCIECADKSCLTENLCHKIDVDSDESVLLRCPKLCYNAYGLKSFFYPVNTAMSICGNIDKIFDTLYKMDLEISFEKEEFYTALSIYIDRLRAERKAKNNGV